jgi:hypothetical protein
LDVIVHGQAALVTALLIFQAKLLDEIKRLYPRIYITLIQALRLSSQSKAIRRIARAGTKGQAVDPGRVDEQRRGMQFEIDSAGEISPFLDHEVT